MAARIRVMENLKGIQEVATSSPEDALITAHIITSAALVHGMLDRASGGHHHSLSTAVRASRDRVPAQLYRRLLRLAASASAVRHVSKYSLDVLLAETSDLLCVQEADPMQAKGMDPWEAAAATLPSRQDPVSAAAAAPAATVPALSGSASVVSVETAATSASPTGVVTSAPSDSQVMLFIGSNSDAFNFAVKMGFGAPPPLGYSVSCGFQPQVSAAVPSSAPSSSAMSADSAGVLMGMQGEHVTAASVVCASSAEVSGGTIAGDAAEVTGRPSVRDLVARLGGTAATPSGTAATIVESAEAASTFPGGLVGVVCDGSSCASGRWADLTGRFLRADRAVSASDVSDSDSDSDIDENVGLFMIRADLADASSLYEGVTMVCISKVAVGPRDVATDVKIVLHGDRGTVVGFRGDIILCSFPFLSGVLEITKAMMSDFTVFDRASVAVAPQGSTCGGEQGA
jgi:hypothetical protein